ncbi:MAG: PASTA domain-containing protein [Prevotella sp.]|nr:PASTA domain-containing protein [Prevotella sp.]
MKASNIFSKFKSWYLWGNLIAMGVVIVLLCVGVKYGLDLYTHHGELIEIPNIKNKSFTEAARMLNELGIVYEVTDTGYVKTLPADCILEQSPAAGTKVKSGHIVYLTINTSKSPAITLPDIIDNSSLREAMAKLTAMGFKVGLPQYIPGEKDWVYGVLVSGRHVTAGERISIEETLIIQAGSGMRDENDSINFVDPVYTNEYGDETDGFESTGSSESSVDDFTPVE